MQDVASFGFVVAAYRSCMESVSGVVTSDCHGGQATFLEALKVIDAFSANPDLSHKQAPVDMSQKVTVGGHSTGGRVALMVAAVRDSPEYLGTTPFAAQLDEDDGALRKAANRIGAVVALHPDPMDDPLQNPDVEGFFGAVSETPTFIVVNTRDTTLPKGACWNDYLSVTSPHKVFLDMKGWWTGGHMEPLYHGREGPFVAYFGKAFAVGDARARELLYGAGRDSLRGSLRWAGPGDGNAGNGTVGLHLCGRSSSSSGGHGQHSSSWPEKFAEFCNATSQNDGQGVSLRR